MDINIEHVETTIEELLIKAGAMSEKKAREIAIDILRITLSNKSLLAHNGKEIKKIIIKRDQEIAKKLNTTIEYLQEVL